MFACVLYTAADIRLIGQYFFSHEVYDTSKSYRYTDKNHTQSQDWFFCGEAARSVVDTAWALFAASAVRWNWEIYCIIKSVCRILHISDLRGGLFKCSRDKQTVVCKVTSVGHYRPQICETNLSALITLVTHDPLSQWLLLCELYIQIQLLSHNS